MAYTMSEADRTKLKKNRFALSRDLLVKEDLLSYMMGREDILTEDMKDEIDSKPVRAAKASHLLDLLPKRGPKAFQVFVEGLLETGQPHLASMLDEELVNQWKRQQQKEMSHPTKREPSQPQLPLQIRPASSKYTVSPQMVTSPTDEDSESSFLFLPMDEVDAGDDATASLLKDEGIYSMKSNPRGRCVIINNEYFVDQTPREGAVFDVANLCEFFKKLYFDTVTHDNKSASEIREILDKERQDPGHVKADAFVLFILSHGVRGHIYGIDGGKVEIDQEIVARFDGHNCRALRKKPKLFFIQACQGSSVTSGTGDAVDGYIPPKINRNKSQDHNDATPIDDVANALKDLQIQDKALPKFTHEKADVLIAYSTVPGYSAWRRADLGSWFVRAIIQVFSKYAKKEHIHDLLLRVRQTVSEKHTTYTDEEYIQLTKTDEQLLKKFYFFPGYYEERVGSYV